MKTLKMGYAAPETDLIELCAGQIICTSTGAGENEGIGYEDWGGIMKDLTEDKADVL